MTIGRIVDGQAEAAHGEGRYPPRSRVIYGLALGGESVCVPDSLPAGSGFAGRLPVAGVLASGEVLAPGVVLALPGSVPRCTFSSV